MGFAEYSQLCDTRGEVVIQNFKVIKEIVWQTNSLNHMVQTL
jgi:uncharacterized protein with HEPN domain